MSTPQDQHIPTIPVKQRTHTHRHHKRRTVARNPLGVPRWAIVGVAALSVVVVALIVVALIVR